MAYQPTEKTLKKKAETRARILKAAHHIVAEEGFRGLSILKVAKAAGVASGSLYRYFASKTELCSEVFVQATRIEVEQVRLALASSDRSIEQFTQAVNCFSRRAIKGRTLAWSLIAEPVDPVVEQDRLLYRQAYAHHFEKAVEHGVKTGQLPKQSPKISAAAIVGLMSETLVGPLLPDGQQLSKDAQEELVQEILAFCLRAIGCSQT